jgi:3-deoxy-D-manno-octulosonic-acid transferase
MVSGRARIDYLGLKTLSADKKTWLFHCASLGEYEMALPIALKIVTNSTNIQVIFSFYSPSGFNNAKLPAGNFHKTYLPWDRNSEIKQFLTAINPVSVVIIRYEFWLNLLTAINNRGIPLYLLGTSFRENQFLWRPMGKAWKTAITKAKYIGVIKSKMIDIAEKNGLSNVHWFGDPKFSRAILRTQQVQANIQSSQNSNENALLQWMSNQNTLVLGSSWPVEEKLLLECLSDAKFQQHFFGNNWKILLAPHDISHQHCKDILHNFSPYSPRLFTEINPNFNEDQNNYTAAFPENCRILVLDSIGQLALAYSAAQLAIIGGGFGKGLHNITEALCFGVPVLFGPKHQKFPEAADAIDSGIAACFNNSEELKTALLDWILHSETRKSIGRSAVQFTIENQAKMEDFVKLTENNS